MKEAEFIQLFERYKRNECTVEEVGKLLHHIKHEASSESMERLIKEGLDTSVSEDILKHPVIRESLENSWQRIDTQLTDRSKGTHSATRQLLRWVPYVAATFLLVLAGIFWYQKKDTASTPAPLSQLETIVSPGGNKAILRFDNGQPIALDESKTGLSLLDNRLTYQDGSALGINEAKLKAGELQHVSIETPRGGQYHVVLPDGTKVWLNAASSLRYPTRFVGDQRIVTLQGEAYFEVETNKEHPFIVQSADQKITVLGTHFNASNYNDETEAKTTLLEGSLDVTSLVTGTRKRLEPGQQSIVRNGEINVQEAVLDEVTAWKNGEFIFHNEALESVMQKIARWYNVEIMYETSVEGIYIWGSISRFENISEVLKMIELTGPIRFKVFEDKTKQFEGRVRVMR